MSFRQAGSSLQKLFSHGLRVALCTEVGFFPNWTSIKFNGRGGQSQSQPERNKRNNRGICRSLLSGTQNDDWAVSFCFSARKMKQTQVFAHGEIVFLQDPAVSHWSDDPLGQDWSGGSLDSLGSCWVRYGFPQLMAWLGTPTVSCTG